MTLLTDRAIRSALRNGYITVSPLPDLDTALGPVSLDLRLGNEFGIYHKTNTLDALRPRDPERFTVAEHVILEPGRPLIAVTHEHVSLSNQYLARLEGRSSLARLFVGVHQTAGIIEPGFYGKIVLELVAHGPPVMLYVGQRICALTFEALHEPVMRDFVAYPGTKYRDQEGVLGSIPDKETLCLV